MPTAGEIIDFLLAQPDLDTSWRGTEEQRRARIERVNVDRAAVAGDLAWISPKQHAPVRVASFKGSLLVAPPGDASPGVPLVACAKPKLAIVRAIDRFFGHLAETTWPAPGERCGPASHVAATARLAPGVVVGSNATVEDDVVVGPNTTLANCVVRRGARIGASCTIGLPGFGFERDETGAWLRFPHVGRVEIREGAEIGSNTCIDRGSIGDTVVGKGCKIDNLVHVAHNVSLGENAMVIANAMIGGSARIGDEAWVAPSVAVMNQVGIGRGATLGLGAVVLKDVEELAVMVGNPAKLLRKKASPRD